MITQMVENNLVERFKKKFDKSSGIYVINELTYDFYEFSDTVYAGTYENCVDFLSKYRTNLPFHWETTEDKHGERPVNFQVILFK